MKIMNPKPTGEKTEPRALLASELQMYRTRSYNELRERIGSQDDFVVAAPSGRNYQIEVDFFWDDRPNGNIRVMAMIDDGGFWSAVLPGADSFILSPAGQFIGEGADDPPPRS